MAKAPQKPKIFLSYAHRDGKDLAFRLFDELKAAGFDPWLDRDRLQPGENWSKGIEQALDAAEVVVAVLSPGASESEICRAEHLRSLRKGNRVLAVRTAENVDPPLYLEPSQWITFGGGADGERLAELTEALGRKGGAKLVERFKKTYQTVPTLPDNYVPRADHIERLRSKLLEESPHRNIAVTAAKGMGGAGKTVLAQALCREDELVQAAFPDGIVWLPVGQNADIVTVMREIPKALGQDATGWDSLLACENELRTILQGKSVLLVLDDVWDARELERFKVDQPRSRILLTTRSAEVVAGAGGNYHSVDELSLTEAKKLLAKQAGLEVAALPEPEAEELISECGRLPLAIAMTGAMVRDGRHRWRDVIEALQEADLEWIDQPLDHGLYESLFQALHASVERLPKELRRSYVDLAVFDQEAVIPETALQALWGESGRAVRKTAQRLVDLSLARRDENGRLTLHDLQHDYVRNQARQRDDEEPTALHAKLADGYRAQCQGGAWHAGPADGYYFENLARHLKLAGREDELRELLLEPRWLQAKLQAAGAHALTLDYEELPEDEDLRLVQGALRLSSHVIERDPDQLAPQMMGRLLEFESQALTGLREGCRELPAKPWLEPQWPTLAPPGTALLRTLAGHSGWVSAVALTADGRRAVSASHDHTLKVWDVETGQALRTLAGHSLGVTAVALRADGRRAVSASDDGTLKVWDVETGEALRTLEGHSDEVTAVALTADGRRAVSVSLGQGLIVWDLTTGEALYTLNSHVPWENAVALAVNGRRALAVLLDRTLGVWDVEAGEALRTLEGHSNGVNAVALTADGRRAASVSNGKTLKVWDVETGEALSTFEHYGGGVRAVALTLDGQRAVSVSWDQTLKVWNVETGEALRTLEGHSDFVSAVALAAHGRRAVSASWDQTLKVWDVETGEALRTLEGHGGAVRAVALTTDGRRAVSTSIDRTLKVWNVETGKPLRTLEGHIGLAVALTADGQRAVSVSSDETLKEWDVETGEALRTLEGHSDFVSAVALTADGRRAVSASHGGTLKVWDVETGEALRTLEGHTNWVTAVALTADGRRAVSASGDQTLKVWDLATGEALRTRAGHRDSVRAVALTADGRRAVSASDDKSVAVWDMESGATVCHFVGDAAFDAVAVSADGELILAGDEAGRLHKLRLRKGQG